MTTFVRPLDIASAGRDEVAAIHTLLAEAHAAANPEEPYRAFEDTAAFLRHPPGTEQRRYWVAGSGGFAELAVPKESGTGKVQIVVRADRRRNGLGTELLAAVREEAGRLGCRSIFARHAGGPGAAFAAAAGAVDARRDVRSLLVLADADLTPPAVDGYSLRNWLGAAPESLVASYADARLAINDAPVATDDEWEHWDVERVRDLEAAVERRDRELRVTVALDRRQEVVGFAELRVSRTAGAVASTEDTAVRREHRGSGVARSIKVDSLRRLRSDRPDVRLVGTTNAESNAPILGLNRSLGFRAVAIYTTSVLRV